MTRRIGWPSASTNVVILRTTWNSPITSNEGHDVTMIRMSCCDSKMGESADAAGAKANVDASTRPVITGKRRMGDALLRRTWMWFWSKDGAPRSLVSVVVVLIRDSPAGVGIERIGTATRAVAA